jgi:glycosyltransferase involved in cell wall biosynthesis
MHVLIAALHRPTKPTGVCRHAANLANCLAEKLEVTQISLVIGVWQQDYFTTAFTFVSPKIKIITVSIKNSSLVRNRWFIGGLPQLANKLKPDIVHLSFPLPFIRAKFESSVVSTIHDLYPYECPENFGFPQVWFNRLFLQQCINNSDGLSCVSQITLNQLKFYFPKLKPQQKIAVIYNYVDFDLKSLKLQPPQQLSEKSTFILTVAQHRQNKNLDLLIEAYAKMLKARQLDRNCQLIIVGSSGPQTEDLQNLITELALKNKVLLLSAIKDEELCWLYQNCHAFIIPSSTEGFCLPLVEALHFSDRIVCSDIPIFKEVGNINCTYFSLKNDPINNLSNAIIQTMDKPQTLHPMNVGKFDKLNIAHQYFNLYSQIK